MTTTTITTEFHLLPEDMAAATRLNLQAHLPAPMEFGWDLSASVGDPAAGPNYKKILSWTGVAGKQYAIRATDDQQAPMIWVYNERGEAIVQEYDYSADGSAYLHDFIAPYSGTFYAGVLMYPGSSGRSVRLYADLDTATASTPTPIAGSGADDKLFSSMGGEKIDGGAGDDALVYSGDRAAYSMIHMGTRLTISAKDGLEGSDEVRNVEQVAFADGVVDLRYSMLAESLYLGYFGRAADPAGLRAFQSQLAALKAPDNASELSGKYGSDAGIRNLIDSFGTSAESKALYPGDTHVFVKAIFNNLLNRAPNQAGLDFWTSAIDSGQLTRANAALAILGGAQSNTSAQGLTDRQTIANKVSVAWNFTAELDVPTEIGAYQGSDAAAAARTLLSMVSATTAIDAYQVHVNYAILSFSPPRTPGDHAHDMPSASAHDTPIGLLGMDTAVVPALLA
ncbi:DUF4214 domain-containing protein [Massilia sp. CCM 9210]|uniref:DUF4214 domain-containing protein n=1 Tax=Massilia scottii TaxID=3057166 RepID=UPI002796DCD6|nr:DUF4214 domain-containing protein [Massilia sp. CCM 9210]MDQ1812911.1 DUF4214 domain-containing protein [Massilia sp. CCM 9210]